MRVEKQMDRIQLTDAEVRDMVRQYVAWKLKRKVHDVSVEYRGGNVSMVLLLKDKGDEEETQIAFNDICEQEAFERLPLSGARLREVADNAFVTWQSNDPKHNIASFKRGFIDGYELGYAAARK